MRRKFFRKPFFVRIKKSWYKEMVKGVKKHKEENCKNEDGSFNCSKCHFSVKHYCLLNILQSEFEE